MAKTWYQHARAETNPPSALGRTTELHPDVGVERRGVVKPGPGIPEILGDPSVLVAFGGGRKRA